MTISEGSWLEQRAADDRRSREEQERLACDYLSWREEEARRLAKAQGIARRLRSGPEDFIDEVDRRSLRVCKDCGEIAYPDPERARHERGRHHVAFSLPLLRRAGEAGGDRGRGGGPLITLAAGGTRKGRDEGRRHDDRTDRLGVRPARLARRSGDKTTELHGALRVLYRDYLAAGGLDSLRARRSHGRPPKRKRGGPR